jgi:hypothetical protein
VQVLLAGIADRLIFFPPADRPDVYLALPTSLAGVTMEFDALEFDQRHSFRGPFAVMLRERLVTVPDVWRRGLSANTQLAYFPPGGGPSHVIPLRQLSPGEAQQLERLPSFPRVRVRRIGSSVPD